MSPEREGATSAERQGARSAERPGAISDEWTRRLLTGTWCLGAFLASGLGPTVALAVRPMSAIAGAMVALFAAWLWGPRTRPRPTTAWWIAGGAMLLVSLFAPPWFTMVAVGAAMALFVVHDDAVAPGAILVIGMYALLRQPAGTWTRAGPAEAWWLGAASALLVIAAVVERDRLAAPTTPVSSATIVARIVWVLVWTASMLALRDVLHLSGVFTAVGVDVARTSGRIALVAILVIGTAAAGLLLHPGKRSQE